MCKELVMTDYLKGLRDLFIKHNITEVYTEYKFSSEKEDGVVLYVNGDREALNAVTDYIDKYTIEDVGVLPEMYSYALSLSEGDKVFTHSVYRDGAFYE